MAEVGYIFPDDAAKQVVEVGNAIKATDDRLLKFSEDAQKLVSILQQSNISFEQLTKAEKKAIETTQQLDTIGKQLVQSEEKLKQVTDKRNEAIIKNRLETQKATQEIKQKVRAQQAEKGSIEQLSAVNAILERRLKGVNLQTEEGRKKADLLRGAIDRNTKKIMDNSSAFSRWKINIGNYQSALEGLPGPLGNIATKASTVTSTLAKIGPIGAIVAGAIAALSAPLIAFFTKSEKGVEMLERKTAGFKAAWNVLVGEMVKGGEKIADTFDKQAEKSTFWTKFMTIAGGPIWSKKFKEIGERMDGASDAAEKYTLKQQELEDAERAMIVPRAKANQQIKEAMLLYQDETKSIGTRMAALQNAIVLENKTADAEIEHQRKVVENIKIVNAEKEKAGLLRDEDDKRLQEAIAREIELSTESAGRQIRATARINAARKELIEQEKQRMDEIRKKQEEEKATQEEINRLKQSEIMIASLKLETIDEVTVTSVQSTQLEIDKLNELNDARLTDIENQKKQAEEELQIAREKANNIAGISQQLAYALEDFATGRIESFKEFQKTLLLIALDAVEKQLVLTQVEILAKEIATKSFAGIATSALLIAGIQIAFAGAKAAIQNFATGTDNAPSEFIAGEAGREIVRLKSGEVILAENATHFKGNKFKGATVYTNRETEQIIKKSGENNNFVFDTKELQNGLKAVEKAINRKPVMITDNSGRVVGKETNNYREMYLNRLRNGR